MIPWSLESLQIDIYVLPIYLLEKTKRVDQSSAKVKKVATPPFLSIQILSKALDFEPNIFPSKSSLFWMEKMKLTCTKLKIALICVRNSCIFVLDKI